MPLQKFALAARSNEFQSVISDTIYTDTSGERHPLEQGVSHLIQQLMNNKEQGGSVYLIGNGGSAAIVSHAITDFINVCRLRAFTLHEPSLITCMANDFGYENAYARIL